ncbi:MAG TPA: SDR family oxidoreductase [Hyphomonas sp.]|nr:SDR family oxidoreductase [Hyphomonas sp.]
MSQYGTAVVTGASSGIGSVYADRLASRGYDLLLVARRGDRLEQTARQLREKYGISIEVLVADLADQEDLAALERRLVEKPVALLVNNAGAGGLGPTSVKGIDPQIGIIGLNIVALVRLSLAALAGFRAAGKGTLVNISSVVAFAPSAGGATYSGSKAFVLNFTRSLAMEYAQSDIRIQAVLPGPIRTEFFTSQGLDNSVFPESAYISAEELVDAALAGLDAGETVTVPTLARAVLWDDIVAAQTRFLSDVVSGEVATRYQSG